jgi:hypothetical protein
VHIVREDEGSVGIRREFGGSVVIEFGLGERGGFGFGGEG